MEAVGQKNTSFFMDARQAFGDTEKMQLFVEKYKTEFRAYGGATLLIFLVWWFVSSGDWSFVLTLASIVSMCSFLMVAVCIESFKSCQGISVKMLEVYLLVQMGRLIAIVPFDGYLPYDRSGDFLYQLMEAFTFTLVGTIVYLCRVRYHHTYDSNLDTFDTTYIIIPCAALSLILHPSLNNFVPSDIMWAFALYLEAVASLPQLFMFQKENKVYPWTAHFLAAQAVSKAWSFLFWVTSHQELHDHQPLAKGLNLNVYLGYWVLLVQGFQLLIMGDFILQYTKCVKNGLSVSMLLSENV